MKTSIYDKHKSAFSNVSAYCIIDTQSAACCVATVALKYPTKGEGRLNAFVHWHGLEMVTGYARGYGYDKRTAAVNKAAEALEALTIDNAGMIVRYLDFKNALNLDNGNDWPANLYKAGFRTVQAV